MTRVRQGARDHRIQALDPAESWTLLVDETGTRFDPHASGGPMGRFAALLVSDRTELPPLGWAKVPFHASDATLHERDRALQSVLDADVGVFGLTLDRLPPTRGESWFVGVAEVINWVLRLLPMKLKKTDKPQSLQVLIEQRGDFHPDVQTEALRQLIVAEFGRQFPHRARKLDLMEIRFITKRGHPYNGYVDIIAHSFSNAATDTKARLKASGLRGACLHDGTGQIRKVWDMLAKGAPLDAPDWELLVHDPGAADPGSIPATLLVELGGRCREDVDLWNAYLAHVQRDLDSKAVWLPRVGRLIEWLGRHRPPESELTARQRLASSIASLENANHHGAVSDELVAEIDDLSARLIDEDAALVCQADLVRAVLATNRFDFAQATDALANWVDAPVRGLGLQQWGRVRSSLGQHAAFVGDHQRADALFAEAIDAFSKLSDERTRRGEVAQTATYRAIAAIDDPASDSTRVRALVGEVISLEVADIEAAAARGGPAQKYSHHLLLRFLVSPRAAAGERSAYLEARKLWRTGEGHPWPLILAYRAMLLRPSEPEAAEELLATAIEAALDADQGPTVHVIGYTLAAVLEGWAPEEFEMPFNDQDVKRTAERLPAATSRIERLREALQMPSSPPEEILAEILPFNFR